MRRGPDPLAEDTITAIATPAGRGAVALVRLSGTESSRVLLALCPSLAGSSLPPRRSHLLHLRHPHSGETLDRALVTFFRAPSSYTGEDCLEISTHGGPLTPHLVLDATLAAGARAALPGEFTRRALLNGKLDLPQAEAILDLVNGTSPALHRAAIHQLERGLSSRIDQLRAGVLRAEALVAYGIDFPEEDVPPGPPERIVESVGEVLGQIERMLRTAPQGELLREGAMVVLAGLPNAGKSSLFNALLGFERSIVADLPGTTRDAVEAPITVRGFPFRLVDTAGLRTTPDQVERMGVEVAQRYLSAADVVLYCAVAGGPLAAGDLAFLGSGSPQRTLLVRTKADLGTPPAEAELADPSIEVSVRTGAGLDLLADALVELSFGLIRDDDDVPLITRGRHARALRAAQSELHAFLSSFEERVPMELAATHLAAASGALEDVVGVIASDDVLGAVFSDFCVGK